MDLTIALNSFSVKVLSTPSLRQLESNDTSARIQLTIENPKDYDIDMQVSVVSLSSYDTLAPSDCNEKLTLLAIHEPFSVPTIELVARNPTVCAVKLLAYEDDLLREGADIDSEPFMSAFSSVSDRNLSSWELRTSHNLAALSIPVALKSISGHQPQHSELKSDVSCNNGACCYITLQINVSRSAGSSASRSDERHGPYDIFARVCFQCEIIDSSL